MSRKNQGSPSKTPHSHRVNHQIRVHQIRVIDADGKQLGIMSPREALAIAEEQGLDLVEVAPNAKPPVCRILDYGKFRYEQSKRAASSKAKAAKMSVKEIRLRPKTDPHDLLTKVKRARSFLVKGDRVKFVLRMRGREVAHIKLWIDRMHDEIIKPLEDVANVVQKPKSENRTITTILEPRTDK